MEMEKNKTELMAENQMLREEIKVAREAAAITARLVVKQFEKTDRTLRHLEAANAQRRAVLDAATQLSIISTDLSGVITLFNRGATNLLGYAADEMVDKKNIGILHLDDELKQYAHVLTGTMPENPDAVTVFAQHVKQQIFQAHEWTYVCRDGELLPVNLSITAFYNARGVMRGYLFTAMDMRSQKRMKQELVRAMETAEAANASKGDFLARMSHEIRTPMNGIIGMSCLMEKTPLNETQENYLDKIQSSARTLLNLINDILDFSKIDAGKLTLESVEFRLEDLLADLFNTIGVQAEKKGLEFLFDIEENLPDRLMGDPLRLGQILINLTGNAIKFTETGEIVVSVKRAGWHHTDAAPRHPVPDAGTPEDTPPDFRPEMLTFSVMDSGIGLEPAQIENLFEAFSQADDSITRKYGGTGLGLSICSQLVHLMGGEIRAEGTPGKGSTFIFNVMLAGAAASASSARRRPDPFQGCRALVVDDNPAAREVLGSMLRDFGMDVEEAADGKIALERMGRAGEQNRPYDAVLLDWIMPGMDGIETARHIQADHEIDQIPALLMVTANNREEARKKASNTGIKAFLTKPVYPSVMFNTLMKMLNRKDGSAPKCPDPRTVLPRRDQLRTIQGARILLVEDNPVNQEVAAGLLTDAGMEVHIAGDGQACLDSLEKNAFDLVLMDIQMPVLDGLETSRIIRRNRKFSALPIVAMTAHAMTGDREKSLNAGMNGHLTKPVEPAKLYEILQEFIPEKATPCAPSATCSPPAEALESVQAPTATAPTAPAGISLLPDLADLPRLKGLDLDNALRRLNHKSALLVKILYDFKKDHHTLAQDLKTRYEQRDLSTVQTTAHTIKGIAGYMGATALFTTAGEMETRLKTHLRQDGYTTGTPPPSRVTEAFSQFIAEIKALLNTLEQLPPISSPSPAGTIPRKDKNKATAVNCPVRLTEKEKDILTTFRDLLEKGEFLAMELLPGIRPIFTRNGWENELDTLTALMDDIEFEAAARHLTALNFGPSHDQ